MTSLSQILTYIEEGYKEDTNPRVAHRKINIRIVREAETRRATWRADGATYSLERDGMLRYLYSAEFIAVLTVFGWIEEGRERAEYEQWFYNAHQHARRVDFVGLKLAVYSVIWLTVPVDAAVHSFTELYITIGYDCIRIRLANEENEFNIEFRSDVEGCRILYDEGNEEVVKGIDYNYLAINEFEQIIASSVAPLFRFPTRKLAVLEFDIEPRQEDVHRYPSECFLRQLYTNMAVKALNNKYVCAETFRMTICKHGIRELQPFDLRFLRPRFLKEFSVRVWDDSHLTPNRKLPAFMVEWDQTEQWKHLHHLDLKDPLLEYFRPNVHTCKTVEVDVFSLQDIMLYHQKFTQNPPQAPNECKISGKCQLGPTLYNLRATADSEYYYVVVDGEQVQKRVQLSLTEPNFGPIDELNFE